MGSPITETGHKNDENLHRVEISSFYMSKYEITQDQWIIYMINNPSHHQGKGTENNPVDYVNWFSVIKYCNLRSISEKLKPCYSYEAYGVNPEKWPNGWDKDSEMFVNLKCDWEADGYRLPTEAEWEYACRAGTDTPYPLGNTITPVDANIDNNVINDTTTAIGSYKPNNWGLYDMIGNVMEWCWDWYSKDYTDTIKDPRGTENGTAKILRGGSYGYQGVLYDLRSSARSCLKPNLKWCCMGFRVVRKYL